MQLHNKAYHLTAYKLVNRMLWFCCVCLLFCNTILSQINNKARYEIDAKRIGISPFDKDALPRSREFIRLDSTYYVGWMLEGLYKFERSSDYLGYKQATIPLQKALKLFEKDFNFKMINIFSSINAFTENRMIYEDFYTIINNLETCYNSIEMPDSTMALFNKVEAYQFQRDFFYTGCGKAWLYHRNRFYNSAKHSFLKNTIAENEVMAFRECFKQIKLIEKNKTINDYWYGPNQSEEDLLTTYHYLALLYDYNQNYDSSQYYYNLLINGGMVSWSNYANMQHVVGNFSEAMINYDKPQYKRKFSLSESDYYMPMILVYGGHTKDAIQMAQSKINESGSTPGFGWYNIALARSYLYDGQLDSCEFFLNKAGNFKELHINTTLTQSQYEFTINLLKIQLIEKKIALIKFFNTGWWYSISDLFGVYALKVEKILLEYALVNALANNPERDKIVYGLFCSESTVSFDESLCLLKDFCPPYFEKKYSSYASNDKRTKIIRYFKLFNAEFLMQKGEEKEAFKDCEKLFYETISIDEEEATENENRIDENFEKLYKFRLLEILARADNDTKSYDTYRSRCFEAFPQLMLFSGIPVKMDISFAGLEKDEAIKAIIDDLKECNIEFTKNATVNAELNFTKKGDTYQAIINVYDRKSRKQIVTNGELLFKQTDGVGRELAMHLFGKGGAVKFEHVEL